MKILFVIPTLSSWPFISGLCLSLRDKGWDVHIAASSFRLRDSVDAQSVSLVQHHEIDFPRGANVLQHFRAAQALHQVVQKIRPDIVDVHFSAAMLTTALAKNKVWPYTSATVQGLRFPNFSGFRGFLEKQAEVWAAKKMNSVWVLSDDDLQELQNANVSTARKQVAFGFGCNLDRFKRGIISDDIKQQALQATGNNADEFRMVYVGRWSQFKGFHIAVRAFLLMAERRKNIRFIACGGFDKKHPSGLTDEEIDQLNNHPNVSVIGWTKVPDHYLAISDISVFPSKREGMPVNLMESLAMGVPVVTLDSRGCRDVVSDGETGIVLSDDSPVAFMQAIESLIDNRPLLEKYSKNALAARSQFSKQKYVSERSTLFADVIKTAQIECK